MCAKTTESTAVTWFKFPTPNPQARLRLFCFPYAGGSASTFRLWPAALPLDIEVCAVQLPGRESRLRDAAFTQMQALVQTLDELLRPHLDRPFAFFGHSMGALIAFELARRLEQNPPGLVHLFVSGYAAPQILRRNPPIHQLPEAQFVAELRGFGGTPEAVLQHPELMALLLPTLRADFSVVERYVYSPGAPLACPISAFGGLQDSGVSRDDLTAWCAQTHGPCAVRMFPGNHFFLHSAQDLVLQTMARDLAQVLGSADRHWRS
jgi:medium-chain acyl-[acyl-carrier-protein] hydrolase